MKATGLVELLIIVSALVCGLPLFLACNIMANTGLNTVYMDDKSTWRIATDIEYKVNDAGILVPISMVDPLKISAAQAAVMPMVQDEYTPNSARSYDYNYNATTLDDLNCSDGTDPGKEFSITLKDNSRATRYGESNVAQRVLPVSLMAERKEKPYYLVFNYINKHWMLTNEFIDIYSH